MVARGSPQNEPSPKAKILSSGAFPVKKMLHVICISQAGESWKIWVPVIPTGAGGGQQGLEHTFHCRANEPLGSVLLIATAILSSGAFPAKECYM